MSTSLLFYFKVENKMNEKRYEKKLDIQQKMISYQSKQIESLESQVQKLRLEIEEKNRIIDSIVPLREELIQNVAEYKKYKNQSKNLVDELRKMKEVINQEVYKGRWRLIKFLIK